MGNLSARPQSHDEEFVVEIRRPPAPTSWESVVRAHQSETTRCQRKPMVRILLATVILTLASPIVAHADPCEGPLPTRAGETFSGTVRYVGDGDSLCVGRTSNPDEWIEVRLADFDAPELSEPNGRRSRDILTRLSRGRQVECTATRGRSGRVVSHDRVIATCRLGARRLGDLLRSQRAPEGGN